MLCRCNFVMGSDEFSACKNRSSPYPHVLCCYEGLSVQKLSVRPWVVLFEGVFRRELLPSSNVRSRIVLLASWCLLRVQIYLPDFKINLRNNVWFMTCHPTIFCERNRYHRYHYRDLTTVRVGCVIISRKTIAYFSLDQRLSIFWVTTQCWGASKF